MKAFLHCKERKTEWCLRQPRSPSRSVSQRPVPLKGRLAYRILCFHKATELLEWGAASDAFLGAAGTELGAACRACLFCPRPRTCRP
eukprot:13836442-Alexandrium_andersonii.AAC.1